MMANPKVGQRVRLHYRKALAASMPHHGKLGTVRIVAKPKPQIQSYRLSHRTGERRVSAPRNHGVDLDDGQFVVVPCGNLMKVEG